MIERIVITLLPVMFLILLFGGGAVFRRRNIDMDGVAPISKAPYAISKYSIMVLWAAMVIQGWGVDLRFVSVPIQVQGISLSLWFFGFALLFIGRLGLGSSFRIGSAKESTNLKTSGLFCLSRNPMYLGVYLTLVATVLYTLNPILLLVAAFIIAVHHKIVLAEEAHLRKVFGQEYADYCSHVRRYL